MNQQEQLNDQTNISFKEKVKHYLAYSISNFGNPFTLLFILVAYASINLLPMQSALKLILLFLLFAFIPTGLFLAINVRRGRFSNYDVSSKAQRPLFYLFSIGLLTFLSLTLFLLSGVPAFIRWGCFASLFLLVSSFAINSKIKSSLHTCFATYTAFAFFALNFKMGIGLTIFALLMGWSRLNLLRHTLGEVISGACLGSAVGTLFYWFMA